MMSSFVNLVICGAIVIGFWREIVKTGVHYSYPIDRVYFVAIFNIRVSSGTTVSSAMFPVPPEYTFAILLFVE